MELFYGCGVALVTPFDERGVNLDAFEKIIRYVLQGGATALFACGTTGEPSAMDDDERLNAIAACKEIANGRVPVFAGSGSSDTARAVAFSQKCARLKVDGLLVVTPYYNKCTQSGAVRHYAAICASTDLPVIAYNVPARTGFNLLPETAARLQDIPTLAGIKEASGNVMQMHEVARLCPRLHLYCGDDALTVPAMSIGAKGVISVAANVAPRRVARLCALCKDGDYRGAAALSFELAPLVKALFCEVNPIPVKAALNLLGFAAGDPRLPLTPLEDGHVKELQAALRALALLPQR